MIRQLEESAQANDQALTADLEEIEGESVDLDKIQANRPVIEGPLVRMARHRSRSLQSPAMRTVQLAGLQDAIEKKMEEDEEEDAKQREQAMKLEDIHGADEQEEKLTRGASLLQDAFGGGTAATPDEPTPTTQLNLNLNHVGVTDNQQAWKTSDAIVN